MSLSPRIPLIAFAAIAVALGASAVFTEVGRWLIERAYPPTGRFVDVEGGRLHVLELGSPDATPVVLLHGASGNLGDMKLALGGRLAERYRVIMVDRPGHGWSDRPGGRRADASPARQAALIRQALQRIGVTRAILVGHSWSGALATAYALAYPEEVSGLVLLAPVTHPWPGGIVWYNRILTISYVGPLFARTLALPIGSLLIGPGVRDVFAPQTPPDNYAAQAGGRMILRPQELEANAWDVARLKAFVTAQAQHYGSIQAPTAIVAGDADDTVSIKIHAQAIAAMLPRGKLHELSNVGHMVHFAAPELVVSTIDDIAAGKF